MAARVKEWQAMTRCPGVGFDTVLCDCISMVGAARGNTSALLGAMAEASPLAYLYSCTLPSILIHTTCGIACDVCLCMYSYMHLHEYIHIYT